MYNETIDNEIDLTIVIRKIWLQKWLIIKITSVFAVFSVVVVLMMDNVYKASVTMLPQSHDSSANKFSGLAALAGVDLSSVSISNEAFYEDVLKSNKVLNKLIKKKWFIGEKEFLLSDFLEIRMDESFYDPKAKLDFDIKKYLREKVISFSSSKENGLMTLTISMPLEPKLSSDIANWLADELHEFNESFRQKKALENVLVVKKQLDEAKSELDRVENNLSDFQKSNKNYTQSVELQLEYARLTREVMTENTVYTELRKQYEISKIDLEKSKETITILDEAIIPVVKATPKRGLICIFVTIFGGVLSIIAVLIKEKFKEAKNA